MRYSKGKAHTTNQIIVISIACLSVVISLLFQLLSGAYRWGEELQTQMKMYVYLEDSLTSSQVDSMVQLIKAKKEIDKNSILFVDKQTIAKDFLKSSHENYQDLLGDVNPFKNHLILEFLPDFRSKVHFEKVAAELRTSLAIYEVTYPLNYVELIIPKIKVISSASFIFIGLIALLIYLQISNYTKLHIHANRSLIKSMQLLGSTNGFIKRPYLLKSVILGLMGALLGYVLTNLFYFYLVSQLPELSSFLFNSFNQVIIISGTMIISVLFSLFSTQLTLNKYLKISASNLY